MEFRRVLFRSQRGINRERNWHPLALTRRECLVVETKALRLAQISCGDCRRDIRYRLRDDRMIVGIREVKMHGGHLARVHIDLRFGRREMPATTAVDGGQELDRDLAGDIDTSAADRNGFVGYSSIQAQCVARSEEHTSELQSLMRISY